MPWTVLPSSGLCLGCRGFRPTSILCCVRFVRNTARNTWITFLFTSDHIADFNQSLLVVLGFDFAEQSL